MKTVRRAINDQFLKNEILNQKLYQRNGISIEPVQCHRHDPHNKQPRFHILDVGANSGLFQQSLVEQQVMDCQIHCFEPNMQEFLRLDQRIQELVKTSSQHTQRDLDHHQHQQLEKFTESININSKSVFVPHLNSTIKIHPLAVTDGSQSTEQLRLFDVSGWCSLKRFHDTNRIPQTLGTFISKILGYYATPRYTDVPCISLDRYAHEYDKFFNDKNQISFHLLKIDCEGAEEAVLHGCTSLLSQRRISQIVMEIEGDLHKVLRIKNLLKSHGFQHIRIEQQKSWWAKNSQYSMLYARLTPPTTAIVIPTFNEQKLIFDTLMVAALCDPPADEIIVVDGGSSDETSSRVADAQRVIQESLRETVVAKSPCNLNSTVPKICFHHCDKTSRGAQMNLGASMATSDYVVFLHADTRVPADLISLIRLTLADPKVAVGAFHTLFSGSQSSYRFVAWNHWAKNYYGPLIFRPRQFFTRGLKCFFGDQALFCRRSQFLKVGGYRTDIGIMEETEFCSSMNQEYGRLRLVDRYVETSARRFDHYGTFRISVIHFVVGLGFYLGFDHQYLQRFYPTQSDLDHKKHSVELDFVTH